MSTTMTRDATQDGMTAERGVGRVRHVKRGTEYDIVGAATLQSDEPLSDGDPLVVYRGSSGDLWARNEREFYDGRFVTATAMTPPDGRDVAEAAVDLEGVRAKALSRIKEASAYDMAGPASDLIEEAIALLSSPQEHDQGDGDVEARARVARDHVITEVGLPWARWDDLGDDGREVWIAAMRAADALRPTPATAGEPSTAEEVLGEGPAFWLNVKREPAGEPSPSLREAIEDVASSAYRQGYKDGYVDALYPTGYDGPCDETEVHQEIDTTAISDGWSNCRDAILALRTAPASSLEGGE